MLRPAHRVANGRRLVRPGRVGKRLRRLQEYTLGDSAILLDHLGGVAGKVPLQDLEDTARVLQGRIFLVFTLLRHLAAAVVPMSAARAAAQPVATAGSRVRRRFVSSPDV